MIGEKLVEEGRAFNKPLLYNQDVDVVLRDFVLTDCASGEVPMEVFGRSDDSYIVRKIEKSAYYDWRYGIGKWWSWDATQGNAIPAFPPQARGPAGAK